MIAQTVRVRLEKDEGILLAQCAANPSILVTGKNRAQVKANLRECIAGYVQAFPQAKRRFFTGGKMKKFIFVENA